jgi:hypothetical protein
MLYKGLGPSGLKGQGSRDGRQDLNSAHEPQRNGSRMGCLRLRSAGLMRQQKGDG